MDAGFAKMLEQLIADISDRHNLHTIILYGSHARDEANNASDIDVAGFSDSVAETIHDARDWNGTYLDLFIYQTGELEHLADLRKLRGGLVLKQRDGAGDVLLADIDAFNKAGPACLSDHERHSRLNWMRKMLSRIRAGDNEARYRHAWLLMDLLESYFNLRGLWFDGPKLAFAWLQQHDREWLALYEKALTDDAGCSYLEQAISRLEAY